MAKIKSYTDLEQSKKLAEFLPLESADMVYVVLMGNTTHPDVLKINLTNKHWNEIYPDVYIPCWSLGALLEEIPSTIVNNVGEDLKLHMCKDELYYLFYENEYTGDMFEIETELYDNMIDACVEMIIRLHDCDYV